MRKYLVFLFLAIFLSGCATPMVANLKKHSSHYVPTSDISKGLVYIYREAEYVGCLRGIYINVNGERIGALNSGTYFVHEADPGEVEISVEDWLGKNPSRGINVEAQKSYYLKAGIKMGLWDADPYINVVAPEEGEGAVQELVYATMKEKDLRKGRGRTNKIIDKKAPPDSQKEPTFTEVVKEKVVKEEVPIKSYGEYYRYLYNAISKAVKQPQGAGSGTINASFVLFSDGALDNVTILDGSSEDAALREAVEKAIKESAPFPPFSEDMKGKEKETFTISLDFKYQQ